METMINTDYLPEVTQKETYRSTVLLTCFLPINAELMSVFKRLHLTLLASHGELIVLAHDVTPFRNDPEVIFPNYHIPNSLNSHDHELIPPHELTAHSTGKTQLTNPQYEYITELAETDAHCMGRGNSADRSLAGYHHCKHSAHKWLTSIKPSIVLAWSSGVYPVSRILHDTARELGIPCYCFERGMLPNTLMLDASGLNAQADLRCNPLYSLPKMGKTPSNRLLSPTQQYKVWYNATRPTKYDIEGQKKFEYSLRHSDEKIILVFGGGDVGGLTPRNTAARINSPGYVSTEDLLSHVVDVCREKNKYKIIFKPHPGDQKKYAGNGYTLVTKTQARELIQIADCVVTGLTTLAYEVLLLEKPLVLCAQTTLSGTGSAFEAIEASQLFNQIQLALRFPQQEHQDAFEKHLNALLSTALYGITDDVPALPINHLFEHLSKLKAIGPNKFDELSEPLFVERSPTDEISTRNSKAQLYFDLGRGFNEADSQVQEVTDYRCAYTFNILPDGQYLKQIRFDPLDNACVIQIHSCQLIIDNQKIDIHPQASSDALTNRPPFILFETQDPQVYFAQLLYYHVEEVKFFIDYTLIATGQAAVDLYRIHAISDQKKMIDEFQASTEELQQKLLKAQNEISNSKIHTKQLQEESNQSKKIDILEQEIIKIRQALLDKESQVTEILSSTSWKSTYPIRALVIFFKKIAHNYIYH